jgi:hypothetical protein
VENSEGPHELLQYVLDNLESEADTERGGQNTEDDRNPHVGIRDNGAGIKINTHSVTSFLKLNRTARDGAAA